MKYLIGLLLICFIQTGHLLASSDIDRSVQRGYRINYQSGLQSNDLKALRKMLQSKGVNVLYPSQRDWKLPTGYLSVSSFLGEDEIKKMSTWIVSVEPSEPTQRYQIELRAGLEEVQYKKLLQVFVKNKIQLVSGANTPGIPSSLLVKAALTPEQIKGIDEISGLVVGINKPN